MRILLLTALLVLLQRNCESANSHEDYAKIVDGQQTDISKHPHQVAILYGGRLTCGGSIIDKKWILTAAHCVFNRPKKAFGVRAGSSTPLSGGVVYKIAEMYDHPKFSYASIDYDIALLELEEELEFGELVRPIALAADEPPTRALAVVTGWGIVAEDYPAPVYVIRAVEVPIVRRLTCNLRYFFKVTERMICAGYTFGGRNVCNGDSGGPLVYNGKQVGIVSWADGCARPISPGVFTNVPNLLDYIRAVTRLNL